MNVLELITEIQRLIDTNEITADYHIEYRNSIRPGRSRVNYMAIDNKNKVIFVFENELQGPY